MMGAAEDLAPGSTPRTPRVETAGVEEVDRMVASAAIAAGKTNAIVKITASDAAVAVGLRYIRKRKMEAPPLDSPGRP